MEGSPLRHRMFAGGAWGCSEEVNTLHPAGMLFKLRKYLKLDRFTRLGRPTQLPGRSRDR